MNLQGIDLQILWSQIGAYALTGAIISAIIQWSKGWIQSHNGKVWWTILISIILGAGVYAAQLVPGQILTVIAGVFAAANTVFALFFDKPKN